MSFVGNILWFIFGGGIIAGLLWFLSGLVLCCTIVLFPLGIACLRICRFAFFPFGKTLVPIAWLEKDNANVGDKTLTAINKFCAGVGNVIWVVLAGFWLSLAHAVVGLCCFLFILTIPFGLAHFKLCAACFAPLGKRVESISLAKELERRYTAKRVDKMLK